MAAPRIEQLSPMLLEQSARPFDDEAYAFEPKHDGFRALIQVDEGDVEIRSRQGVSMTKWFPEIGMVLPELGGGRHVIDGEIIVPGMDGFAGDAEFKRLVKRAARRGYRAGDDLVAFVAFDLLVHSDRSVMALPWHRRRTRLHNLFTKLQSEEAKRIAWVTGHVEAAGTMLYRSVLARELEGIVAKRLASPYRPGERAIDWLKIKRPGAVPRGRFREA